MGDSLSQSFQIKYCRHLLPFLAALHFLTVVLVEFCLYHWHPGGTGLMDWPDVSFGILLGQSLFCFIFFSSEIAFARSNRTNFKRVYYWYCGMIYGPARILLWFCL
ncbi:hypothetical protein Pan189_22780 [Stratiformator vulcanicus]|uniref:Uncharacterized protein n=1 Tax=Stratiformator vulcanicus TaxID=2527980 RepID=A0A517R1X8_9PLAN|nr:hypothetical protein Pan189_22780 [Stratiformator vulcanicus]